MLWAWSRASTPSGWHAGAHASSCWCRRPQQLWSAPVKASRSAAWRSARGRAGTGRLAVGRARQPRRPHACWSSLTTGSSVGRPAASPARADPRRWRRRARSRACACSRPAVLLVDGAARTARGGGGGISTSSTCDHACDGANEGRRGRAAGDGTSILHRWWWRNEHVHVRIHVTANPQTSVPLPAATLVVTHLEVLWCHLGCGATVSSRCTMARRLAVGAPGRRPWERGVAA